MKYTIDGMLDHTRKIAVEVKDLLERAVGMLDDVDKTPDPINRLTAAGIVMSLARITFDGFADVVTDMTELLNIRNEKDGGQE